ncbi:MAG: NirA family protein [Verrucomicrobia bacterium]|nr:NirA family protein [Verrucomicrobiota bacterium]NBU08366.1 NirA family protein [Pseudomonadota bacterium]NDA66015.1 NirA family protein [Verrucomicrobiota bacterium]NDB74718.1 NirA family protein [Verrucomicrobiota bacterium]NDD37783.1 NirA family protein [Verrucomicrobiota bacterium]
MSTAVLEPSVATGPFPFTAEQKEFLSGFMAGVAQRGIHPYVGATATGQLTGDPAQGGANLAEETIYGTPLADVTKQERWKHEEHPLDGWDRILAHAEAGKLPDEENTFRFRNFGMFHVSPAQNSFMLRCRIPAGELTALQMRGLADIADDYGNGKSAVTTRSNLQIREIAPANLVNVITRLQSLGLTARGSGVDNIRNITASPTAGFDPRELLDTRPFAHSLHHYILNHREFYNLPRKFNVAFEGGGAVDTVADTNDIGFMAVKLAAEAKGDSLKDATSVALPAGIYFRVELCGITGHKQLAKDSGILVKPTEALAVCAAMIRVFLENGDRTDRKKARLKYLIDKWGVEKFLAETQKKLAFPLVKFPLEQCIKRPAAVKHGHIGVYRQKQAEKNYIGVVVPVGVLTTKQMRRIADLAANYGSGALRLTPWQNVLIPDVPDGFVETVKRQLVRLGLHHEATNILGGLVACTGNTGCKWAATDTKGQAVALGAHLNKKLQLDHPINIHLTGCPNSCAQHYVGDIGLQGVKVGQASSEGYHVVFGGGTGADAAIGKQVFTGIPFSDLPVLLERVLKTYQAKHQPGETFAAFTRRHEVKQLQEMFSE